jgi:hypothetical protein
VERLQQAVSCGEPRRLQPIDEIAREAGRRRFERLCQPEPRVDAAGLKIDQDQSRRQIEGEVDRGEIRHGRQLL